MVTFVPFKSAAVLDLDGKRAIELLEQAGCTSVHGAPRTGPAPMELVLGQKRARS
jgi:hypothetical protein